VNAKSRSTALKALSSRPVVMMLSFGAEVTHSPLLLEVDH
jgi:hypothetical protein